MQIKIEIDVRPEELRRFLGLPDIAGLQEDLIEFVRSKVGQASENFDAGAFVKGNLKLLSRNPTLRKLLDAGRRKGAAEATAAGKPAARPARTPAARPAPKAEPAARKAVAKRVRAPKAAAGTATSASPAAAGADAASKPSAD